MINSCAYCNSLKTGIDGDNFCSVNGVNQPFDSVGNSFLVKSKNLNSGHHISRLTFRSVMDGYQSYKVEGKEHMITKDNYLIVRKGENYNNEINSIAETESVIVAFGDHFEGDVYSGLTKSEEKLLDNPYASIDISGNSNLFNSTYTKTPIVSEILQQIKKAILEEKKSPMLFEQLHYALMRELINNHNEILHTLNEVAELKKSTKIELYRRISVSRDYMEANFNKPLKLKQIADSASLSPYHFLRSFKKIFKVTPLEYLTTTRLKYAQYLLINSETNIQDITLLCGFENHSSFTRLFKNYYHTSPSAFTKHKFS